LHRDRGQSSREFSIATGAGGSAFGFSATAKYYSSAAFGESAVAIRNYQQVFGWTGNTYTMPGITSLASKNAQKTGTKYVVTSDTDGNLATAGLVGATLGAAEDLRSQFAALQREVNELRQRVQRLELPQVAQGSATTN
jgi:hypothetical protein